MKKTVAFLIIGLALLSLFWSNPIVVAQEPEEPEGDGGDSTPTSGADEPSDTGAPGSTSNGTERGEGTGSFEIPTFVLVI